jgi:subtilisin-like proprotein convertase family protein
MVFLAPGADVNAIARDHGMVYRGQAFGNPDVAMFDRPRPELQQTVVYGVDDQGPADALTLHTRIELLNTAVSADLAPLRADPRIRFAGRNGTTANRTHTFAPDDPLFAPNGAYTGAPGQWYQLNTFVPGRDIRISNVWTAGWTGLGVVVGVVDDSVDIAHPDLAPNVLASASFDFGQNDLDPTGVTSADRHGTSVAGLIAARGGNTAGVTGGAPEAQLAGLRVDFVNQTAAQFASAVLHQSSGANTTIKIKNHSYGYTAPFIENSTTNLEEQAASDSAAAGTIHFYSAGNNRGTSSQDSNKLDSQSSPDVITVAAFASSGIFADYSSFGANVFVTVPSSSRRSGEFRVITTDRVGALGYNTSAGSGSDGDLTTDLDYNSTFGGTSAASPIAASIAALVKEVNPGLNTRLMKHYLARTSDVVDAGDATSTGDTWRTNAAGFRFNQNYGFGLIDAEALVAIAQRFPFVTPLQTFDTGTLTSGLPLAVPDNNAVGITQSINIAQTTPLEEVLVTVDISHVYRGNLEGFLTSPGGTTSRVWVSSGSDNGDNIVWTFAVNTFWGENPFGTWSLRVADRASSNVGTWNSWGLTLRMGTITTAAIPEPAAMSLLAPAVALLLRRRR